MVALEILRTRSLKQTGPQLRASAHRLFEGLRPLHAASGDILGVILAEQRGHLRQDFFRSVRNLARLGRD